MSNRTVRRKIFIYQTRVGGVQSLDPSKLATIFSERHIPRNTIPVDGEKYVFVVYNIEGNLLAGIFVKEKDLSQVIIDKTPRFPRIQSLFKFGRNQEPGEPSHLVWDIEKKIILSEMNWAGARHISKSFGKYLSEVLGREININPIFHEESYKLLFVNQRILKKASLFVSRPHVNLVHDALGIDVKQMKKYTDSDDDLELEISLVCKKYKKGVKLIPEKVIDLYNKIKTANGDNDMRLLVQDNNQQVLSLLDGALVQDSIDFEINDKTKVIDKEDFFTKVKDYWESKQEEILSIIQHV